MLVKPTGEQNQVQQIVSCARAWRGGVVLSPLLVVPGQGICPESTHKAQTGLLFDSSDLGGLA